MACYGYHSGDTQRQDGASLGCGGVSRSLRSNVRLEWILYRVRDERIHGDRDDCLQPKTRLQTVSGGGKQEP